MDTYSQLTPDLPLEWTADPSPSSESRLFPLPEVPAVPETTPLEPLPEPPPWLPTATSVPLLAGLIVLLWPSPIAPDPPAWTYHLNPVTGRPYRNRQEYDDQEELWRSRPEEVKRQIAEAQLEKANAARNKAREYSKTDPLVPVKGCAPSASSSASGEDDPPSKENCKKAIKILEQFDRLAKKYGVNIQPGRLGKLRELRDQGKITSNDLPGTLSREFPGEFAGLTLDEIRLRCRNR